MSADIVLQYTARHSASLCGRPEATVTETDRLADPRAAQRLAEEITFWQGASEPRLRLPIRGGVVARVVTIHPRRDDAREAPAEAGHTDDTRQYRRAADLLTTVVVISSDGPGSWDANRVRGILIHILLKAGCGHDRPEPITQEKWQWGNHRADEFIEAARAAVRARDQHGSAT
ncbi:hypothetical protein AB0L44_15035 [Nonomuraea wenchangensis]|uniref:hypothetical protein n=1 Tax=Nonomuraea wenchangensis TaxID=568860 RepID=UPI003446FB25